MKKTIEEVIDEINAVLGESVETPDEVGIFVRSMPREISTGIGGSYHVLANLNTPANIPKGEIYFNIEWTPVYPANKVVE